MNLAILYFYMQFLDKQQEDIDDDLDYIALESGYVSWLTKLSFGMFSNVKCLLNLFS